ncbi:HET-domain-containing protein, partial [Aulographum hederae CBS 113979]
MSSFFKRLRPEGLVQSRPEPSRGVGGGEPALDRFPSYEPLGRCQFRLVHLRPSKYWADPIAFEFQRCSLQPTKLPFYEAVSYTWGPIDEKGTVTYAGRRILVGKNVEALLRRFRLKDNTRLLWIDALCINQEDHSEKSEQVAMMDVIYQGASRVLIYLGEADEQCNNANSDSIMMHFGHRWSSEHFPIQKMAKFFDDRSWFSRMWVLQEVALAEHPLVVCGSCCIPWACIPAWWIRNSRHLEKHKWAVPPALSIDSIGARRNSLLQLLHSTRLSRATMPHDKVYGLIGLLSPMDKASIPIDYRREVEHLYTGVATSIIKQENSLKLLS